MGRQAHEIRRGDAGEVQVAIRGTAGGQGCRRFGDWFRWLDQATGIKLTILYDAFDRARFARGFVMTPPSRRPASCYRS
jgi:hypothetical protein